MHSPRLYPHRAIRPTPCKNPYRIYLPREHCHDHFKGAFLFLVIISVGMPRPSSLTVIELSLWIMTSMFLQNQPALRQWNCHNFINKMVQSLNLMSPMYIAGRLCALPKTFKHLYAIGRIFMFYCFLLSSSSILKFDIWNLELVAAKSQVSSTITFIY